MSDKLGPIAFEKMQQQFIEGYGNARRNVSAEVAKVIDAEVKQMVDNAHHIALTILDKNRELLEETANELLEKEILEGEKLRERLQKAIVPEELMEWLRTGKLSDEIVLMQSTI
jgi:cell division protease FtsH